MFNFNWQEETWEKHQVAVVAPRRAGKTYAAIEWARHAGRKVLFVVSNAVVIPHIVDTFCSMYPEGLRYVRRSHACIVYDDGTEIHIQVGRNERVFRGMRVDAVVIDDADYISEESFINAVICCTGRKLFVACTSPVRGAAKLAVERFPNLHKVMVHSDPNKNITYKWLLESAY